MSELPDGVAPAQESHPRDSAAAIVVRQGEDGWHVLMGVRSRRSRFMPGHLAFPGGSMDPGDRSAEPGAFERCVARELLEETGLDIPVRSWRQAGERVTPPMFSIRFRTVFFVAALAPDVATAELRATSEENEDLRMAPAGRFLEEWERGEVRVPPPALPILRTLADAGGASIAELTQGVRATNEQEQRAPRIEFVPRVWMLPVRTSTLPPATHTNVWMPGGKQFVIIDPGSSDRQEVARLLEVVERRRLLGHEPIAVLLTHHHRDHVGGALALARALALPVRAHPQVLETLGPPSGVELSALRDRDRLDLAGMSLEVLATPGHAPGHLAFHLVEPRLLVGGDLLSGVSTILIDPQHGDMGVYMDSLSRVSRLGCRMVLPAHGHPLPARSLELVIAHRRQREARVLNLVGQVATSLERIARGAYRDTPQMPPALTERQTTSHLLLLERCGEVERCDPAGNSWRLARQGGSLA